MSLTQYNSEPPTNGTVQLELSSSGAVTVELWSRECPRACRNFVQLCLEGYYDGCIFHRIVKDLLLQTGDPTGTGAGGESVYGEPFQTEVHSRLKFTRRGLLAMAGTKGDNNSQFFITLGPCSWLDRAHTIFGRVAGNGIFFITPLGELETDDNERPMFPPKILKATVLDNPFDDIVPRETVKQKLEKSTKQKVKGRKDFSLISFGEEAQEEEQELMVKAKDSLGMKSSHDVLSDKRLLKETAYNEEELRAAREKAKAEEEKKANFLSKVKAAAHRAGDRRAAEEGDAPEEQTKKRPRSADESWRNKAEKDMLPSELSMKRAEEAAEEYQRLKLEMLRYKKAKKQEEEERLRREADPQLTVLEQRRLKYMQKKTPKTAKEQRTLEKMEKFKHMLSLTYVKHEAEKRKEAMLKQLPVDSDEEEEEDYLPVKRPAPSSKPDQPNAALESENLGVRVEALMDAEADDEEEEETENWLQHRMQCARKDDTSRDDDYVVVDPLEGKGKVPSKAERLRSFGTSDPQKRALL